MLVAVQSSERLHSVALPANVGGAHWIVDAAGTRLAHVLGEEGSWRVEPCERMQVRGADGGARPMIDLDPSRLSVINLNERGGEAWCLVFYPNSDDAVTSHVYGFAGDREITIGRASENDIVYPSDFVSARHVRLTYHGGVWNVADLGSSNGAFVNGLRLPGGSIQQLSYGDVVVVLGLRVTVGKGLLSCNHPMPGFSVGEGFVRYRAPRPEKRVDRALPERQLFYPALRFARSIEKKSFTIDAPPQPEREDETSLAMRVGPSLIMAFASIMSAAVFVTMMADQGSSMLRAVPMVAMAVAMLVGSVLWPILNARHQRKQRERKEAQRQVAYSQYVNGVRSELAHEMALQQEILSENRISVGECMGRALARDSRLMDRTSLHADYLDMRLGLGEEPFEADIRYPDQHFSLVEDDLREAVEALAREPRVLGNVPVALPLIEKNVVGVIGEPERVCSFVRGLVVQVAALCSYEDVKIMVLCDEVDRAEWFFASHLPHCFSDDKAARFFACGLEEAGELGLFVERVIESRRESDRFDAREAEPYYVVVCASETLTDRADVVRAIVETRDNRGVSLVATAREMKDLPKECRSVIGLEQDGAYLLDRDDPSGSRKLFSPDIAVARKDAEAFARAMSGVHLDLAVESQHVPSRLGFLEMFHAANADHINIPARWKESNAAATLACCVGVDAQGEPFLLNLHERFHGPHGLIAGTTGSGKSEFIITFILSMAMTYSPDDVAFVLIDYKGGGLAKAFDNEHVRLPHLAGVITNLDGAAIARSLVSIQSELKRRQALFNRARDVVGGDNVDIYDYLDLFRQGKMTEPCPHLFIVADEFAELRHQESDFMDELISAARIGRSLGVHLILATQKPSGVVNDQIWSNARFKVCLKVADASDSNEMIKRPDAAELTQAGRFYLLVGYNEYFALGQSGYSGTRYVPHERFEATKDDSVALVSDTGRSLVAVKPHRSAVAGEDRPESVVMLSRIEQAAEELGVRARQLWLEPVPAMVTVDGLVQKYGEGGSAADVSPWDLEAVAGELDDPANQRQAMLTLPLSREGSVLVYGTPDSGVETLLCSLLYSLLRSHDAKTLHAYVLDFGSESLRAFAGAPQVGDVVCAGDDEKISRFFDFMERELAERRKLLSSYGGSLERYACDHDDKPALLVMVNDVAAFMELYPKLEDRMIKLTREAGRGGLHLVMTGAGTSSVRLRMRSNFRQVLACNLPDTSEYGVIFGSMRGVPEPHGFARGLVKTDEGVFEFQGAHVSGKGDEYAFVATFCDNLAAQAQAKGASFAPAIPTAPEQVTTDLLACYDDSASRIPYGVYHADLSIASFDFEDSPLTRCVFQRKRAGASFLRAFTKLLSASSVWDAALLDLAELYGSKKPAGCAFATRQKEQAKVYLDNLVKEEGHLRKRPLAVVVTGMVDFLNGAGIDFNNVFKEYLRRLSLAKNVVFVLVDAASNASYAFEDWFKVHLTNKDGLWVGPGIESQNAIGTMYSGRLLPDSEMERGRGYEVNGGAVQLVHLVSEVEEKDGENID